MRPRGRGKGGVLSCLRGFIRNAFLLKPCEVMKSGTDHFIFGSVYFALSTDGFLHVEVLGEKTLKTFPNPLQKHSQIPLQIPSEPSSRSSKSLCQLNTKKKEVKKAPPKPFEASKPLPKPSQPLPGATKNRCKTYVEKNILRRCVFVDNFVWFPHRNLMVLWHVFGDQLASPQMFKNLKNVAPVDAKCSVSRFGASERHRKMSTNTIQNDASKKTRQKT